MLVEGTKILPQKKKTKSDNMVAHDIRIFQKVKNKGMQKKILKNAKKETLSYHFIQINSKINFLTLLPPALPWVGDNTGLLRTAIS